MDLKDKNIIVFGLGLSGKSSVKALSKLGANVFIYDDRSHEEMQYDVFEISEYDFRIIQEDVDINWDDIYCVIKSPGIKPDNEFLQLANENNVEVLSDIEIAYRVFNFDKVISVTGTNGKTTVTSLINHILNENGLESKIVGNIGVGLLWEMYLNKDRDLYYVLELSSFQLHSIKNFNTAISIITNISEDHIDWHGSYKNYIEDKFNIFKNKKTCDLLILNKDDEILNKIVCDSRIKYFSLSENVDCYFEDDCIVVDGERIERNNIKLVGKHNIQNVMASILAAKELGLNIEQIKAAIKTFNSIEHRIEFVTTINGVSYYNDSKGTNIDSTVVAIDGFDSNIILIAGGYDKNNDFDDLFEDVDKYKALVLIGQTKEKIKETAIKYGLEDIYIVETMEDAVKRCFEIADQGDTVLLSPASASWGMYKNYEERGNHFKKLVKSYEKKKD